MYTLSYKLYEIHALFYLNAVYIYEIGDTKANPKMFDS